MDHDVASRTTTVRTTKVSSSGGSAAAAHVPISQGRQIVIARSAHSGGGGMGGSSMSASMSMGGGGGFRAGYQRSMAMSAGASSAMAATGVNNIVQGRTKEKKDMQELNQRFASYIEKVRFLEAQNRKLASELTGLRERWGKETEKVKIMYEGELKQLRSLLDECERNKAELEVRITSLEDRVSELQVLLDEAREQESIDRETIDKLNQMITDYEGEITLLRKRVSRFDEDRARDKKEVVRLREEIARLRTDLDQETLAHINAENECQTAREELEFQKQIHEAELKELAGLAYRDTTAENRDFWKAELAQAIHDIQSEYDTKLDTIKGDLENMYRVRVSEFRTTNTRGNMEMGHIKEENTRVKTQLTSLRDRVPELEAKNASLETQIHELMREVEELRRDQELERATLNKDLMETRTELAQVLDELQTLLDAKLSLELEIVAYRKLLEGEEARSVQEIDYGKRMDFVLPPKSKTNKDAKQNDASSKMGVETVAPVEPVVVAKAESGVKSSPSGGGDSSGGKSARSEMMSVMHGEMSARTQFQRTAKGNVSIKECSNDGSNIVIENTGSRKQDISGWTITRDIDNGRQKISFTLPGNCVLEADGASKTIVIWAKGHRPRNSRDLECNDSTWGVGSTIVITALLNEKGEERATHTARMIYQSSAHTH